MADSTRKNLQRICNWTTGNFALTAWFAAVALLCPSAVTAQNHLQLRGDLPPGAVGQATASKRSNVFGYVQPTRLSVPKGSRISFVDEGRFVKPRLQEVTLGLRIGSVYRFKITSIRNWEGLELFPSVEVINRLYPAKDKYLDFPVEVQLTQDDLESALNGKLITKVIYLENPRQALPAAKVKGIQRTLVVGAGEDALEEAERLGRPMAILRLGSRTPDESDIGLFGAPQATDYAQLETKPQGDGTRWSPDGLPWPLDEYLFDGGDKNQKSMIGDDFSIKGVDVEDTIVHFDTLDGEREVRPSNRVPIYAPRFAAIQKSYGLIVSHQNQKFMGVDNRDGLLTGRRMELAGTSTQQWQPRGTLATRTPSVILDETRGLKANNVLAPRGLSRSLKLYEDFQVVQLGRMDNRESLRLNIGLQAAQEWDHYAAIQVVVDNTTSNVARRVQNAQELIRDKPIPGSSNIRIIKLANKNAAQPGDEVNFTIRFDNVGTKKVGNVTIIDNLTTRLSLVKGSASCSLKHDFLTQPNEKDSLILRWEITDPLQPGEGGLIRFKCRVR